MDLSKIEKLLIIPNVHSYLECTTNDKTLKFKFNLVNVLILDNIKYNGYQLYLNKYLSLEDGRDFCDPRENKNKILSLIKRYSNAHYSPFWNISFKNIEVGFNLDLDNTDEQIIHNLHKCNIKIQELEMLPPSSYKELNFKGIESSFISISNIQPIDEE